MREFAAHELRPENRASGPAGSRRRLLTTVIHDPPETLEAADQWGRRRGNVRHQVSLPAVITDRLQIPVRCRIEDVSSTGMALRLEMRAPEPGREPLQQGTRATIEFAPDPEHAPADTVSVAVQIMWRTPVGCGIRFIHRSEELLNALRGIARAAVQARAAHEAPAGDASAERRKTMLACRRTLEKLLPNIIWALRTETSKRLRSAAETMDPAEAREARLEADLIDEKANAIGRTIERQFIKAFVQSSDLEETQELTLVPAMLKKTPGKAEAQAIKMVAEQVAEQNALVVAIVHAAEERHKLKLFELGLRLASVIGHPLDRKSSPILPATACRILWQATIDYCDSPRVRRSLHDAMRTRVVPLLGDLYDALDATLDQEGVDRPFNHLG